MRIGRGAEFVHRCTEVRYIQSHPTSTQTLKGMARRSCNGWRQVFRWRRLVSTICPLSHQNLDVTSWDRLVPLGANTLVAPFDSWTGDDCP